MMNQETYMFDIKARRDAGWTITEIADETGHHPATISKWLKAGGPPPQRAVADSERVISPHWALRIDDLLSASGNRLLSTSIHETLVAEGFGGSYPSVARYVHAKRGPRFKPAPQVSVPIETGPAEESQFDFSDCDSFARRWGWDTTLLCFGAILCWSRVKFWWFTTSVDRHHTFEGLIRFYEHIGGVTHKTRTDRMGALGTSQGRRFKLHPPTLQFASAHNTEICSCQARDAKRKGKIERPFRDLKEVFLEEVNLDPPSSIDELNRRAVAWLDERRHSRVHRTTGVTPNERFATERDLLLPLPLRRFDTDYVESRRVHRAVPLIEYRGVRYSVPPHLLGQMVECRCVVGSDTFVVRAAGAAVAVHVIAPAGSDDVWNAGHRATARSAALGRRPELGVVDDHDVVVGSNGIEVANNDYSVAAIDLDARVGGVQ